MQCRNATEADLALIMLWVTDAVACRRWAGPNVSFPIKAAQLAVEIEFDSSNSYVLDNARDVIAFGQLLDKKHGVLHFARIIVNPGQRGEGYGRRICQHLIDVAEKRDCQRVSLNVYRHNHRALSLYQSLGFKEVVAKSSNDSCFMVRTPAALNC